MHNTVVSMFAIISVVVRIYPRDACDIGLMLYLQLVKHSVTCYPGIQITGLPMTQSQFDHHNPLAFVYLTLQSHLVCRKILENSSAFLHHWKIVRYCS